MPTHLPLAVVRGASPAEIAARVESLIAGSAQVSDFASGGLLALSIVARDGKARNEALAWALPSLKAGRAIHDVRRGVFFDPEPKGEAGLAFLFPGQGSQSTGMLLGLRGVVPGFDRRLAALDSASLLASIDRPRTDSTDEELRDTRRAQPAIGLVSVAIAQALIELGVRPRFSAGHSYGELAALAIAGAWDEATFMRASRARGEILAEAPGNCPGAMAAVFAKRALVESLLGEIAGLVIANVNAPEQCVVSGDGDAIARLEALAAERGVRAVRLRTACAFHSPRMAPAVTRFRALLDELPLSAPRSTTYSNVTAAPYGTDARVVRELLAAQIVEPVRWVECVEAMYAAGARVFLETGPGRVLTGLVGEILGDRPHVALAIDPGSRAPDEHFALVLAALVAQGMPIDAARFVEPPRAVVVESRPADARLVETAGHVVARYFEQQANLVASCADAPAEQRRALVEQALAANERIITAFLDGNAGPIPTPRATTTLPPKAHAPPGSEEWIRARIAEVTGFPLETIRNDSDFESELGLDSLTRTELYAALLETIPAIDAHKAAFRGCRTVAEVAKLVASLDRTALPRSTLRDEIVERLHSVTGIPAAELAAARDLAEIGVDAFTFEEVLRALVATHPALAVAGRELAHARSVDQLVGLAERVLGADTDPTREATLERFVRIELPAEPMRVARLPSRVVLIGAADDGNVAALAAEIEARGARAQSIVVDARDDFASLGRAIGDGDPPGLIFLARGGGDWDTAVEHSATALFVAAKALASQQGAAWLAVLTDGSPASVGARGVARALAREWPEVTVRAVQIEGAFDARRALDVASGDRTELDLVLRDDRLLCERLSTASLDRACGNLELPRNGVVIVVGGGDGIGAEIAVGIAKRFGVSIATIARTALPASGTSSERRPGETQKAHARRAGRERALLALQHRVTATGASFRHVVADATIRDELARAFDTIRADGRPIVGVVHAVGTTEDALLGEKSVDSFRRVLHTKARSIDHLRAVSKDDPLAFALVFSSLAAHTGTPGQTDYVAANEIVGAAAAAWNAEVAFPVRAILWSVWSETGLASAALKRQMKRLGLPGITNANGVAAAVAEIERGEKRDAWVLLSPRAMLDFAGGGAHA